MKQPYEPTPLIRSAYLSDLTGANVLLKLENNQPSGSFKSRGVGELVKRAVAKDPHCHVFSSSGGNAGLAAATAAQTYGVGCTVVVPTLTKQSMKDRIAKIGAQVIVHGNVWAEADEHLRELMDETQQADKNKVLVYCHPFDNPAIWEGHSSMVDELSVKPDYIIVSVGGGGLLAGVAQGLDRHGYDSQIIAVETEGAPTLNESIKQDKVVKLSGINTVATTLGASFVTTRAFEVGKQARTNSVLVSDAHAVDAVVQFAEDHKIIVEPACGAALAVCYHNKVAFPAGSTVVVVVCGGTATSLDMLEQYRKQVF